jgi:carbonic anhydrase
MTVFDDFLASSERFAAETAIPQRPAAPARHVAILACMDARIDVFRVLGLQLGDAHVIRNAGGRASDDVIRSLIVSTVLLQTREIVVMHHSNCGMETSTNEEIHSRIVGVMGAAATEIDIDIDFLSFTDLDQSVRDDVERIERSLYLGTDTVVNGCVYDVESGQLRPVSR